MQVYLDPSHPQQGQLHSDLSRLEAVAQPYDELGLVWDCGARVIDTDNHIHVYTPGCCYRDNRPVRDGGERGLIREREE